MLGAMLGCHSQCICIPETQFMDDLLAWADPGGTAEPRAILARIAAHPRYRLFWDLPISPSDISPAEAGSTCAQVLTWLAGAYGRKTGKPAAAVWVDHTPTNFRRIRALLRMFPEARFIHLVRDGRAVAASLLPLDWGPNNVLHAAEFWMARCALGLAAELDQGPTRVLRVRYEDVLRTTEASLRRIATFAGLEYEAAMESGRGSRPSRYHQAQHRLVGNAPDLSRVDRWQQLFSRREVEIFEAEAGELLASLGYEPKYGIRALPATRFEVLRLRLGDLGRRIRNNLHRQWRVRRSLIGPGRAPLDNLAEPQSGP